MQRRRLLLSRFPSREDEIAERDMGEMVVDPSNGAHGRFLIRSLSHVPWGLAFDVTTIKYYVTGGSITVGQGFPKGSAVHVHVLAKCFALLSSSFRDSHFQPARLDESH
jgi:hypothetical protein